MEIGRIDMHVCASCGLTHKNSDFFHTKYNNQIVCLRCWLNELEQFAKFCQYWRHKTTSEHGKTLLQNILTETKTEIAKTKQTIEQLRAHYRSHKS
jgi:hypothetical protein